MAVLLSLAAAAATFALILAAPARRLARLRFPQPRAGQPMLHRAMSRLMDLIGKDCPNPPAPVLRAFHRGERLIMIKGETR